MNYRRSAIGNVIERELWERAHCEVLPIRRAPVYVDRTNGELISTVIYNHEKETTEVIPEKGPLRDSLQSQLVYLLSERLNQRQEE